MKIKYLGHSSFLLVSRSNQRIITDPYTPGYDLKYNPINEPADIVTVSHSHDDHNNSSVIKGNPVIIKNPGSQLIKGIEIRALSVYHDANQGTKRGRNLIFCFNIDGLNICHLGDLGHTLNPEQISWLGPVDILMIPVGGYYTINAQEATGVVQSLHPGVVIPMHFKTPKLDYPIQGVDEFLKGKNQVSRLNSSEIEFTVDALPKENRIVVLQPAL
jgi:L-ascorbate metabolism protein UlaG (beta-lactamase superfamily)